MAQKHIHMTHISQKTMEIPQLQHIGKIDGGLARDVQFPQVKVAEDAVENMDDVCKGDVYEHDARAIERLRILRELKLLKMQVLGIQSPVMDLGFKTEVRQWTETNYSQSYSIEERIGTTMQIE